MAEKDIKPVEEKKATAVKAPKKTEATEKTIEAAVKKDVAKAVEKVKTSKKSKVEAKPELEREYTIPLREKCRSVARYKKTNKAVKTVKEFLVKHMKIRDRDLNKVKLDTYLNEYLWGRGIRHPPHKVKVKAVKIGEIVKVELVELPKKLSAKRSREENFTKKLAEAAAGKKKKVKAPEKEEKKSESDVKAETEKKSAVVEAGAEMEKAMAKKAKHTVQGKDKSPIVKRKALSR